MLWIIQTGLEEGQNEVEDCLESDHDEDDECDEKRRKVSKVRKFKMIYIRNFDFLDKNLSLI